MSPRAEDCRGEALRLRHDAETVTNVWVRRQLLDIAHRYERLATMVDVVSTSDAESRHFADSHKRAARRRHGTKVDPRTTL